MTELLYKIALDCTSVLGEVPGRCTVKEADREHGKRKKGDAADV